LPTQPHGLSCYRYFCAAKLDNNRRASMGTDAQHDNLGLMDDARIIVIYPKNDNSIPFKLSIEQYQALQYARNACLVSAGFRSDLVKILGIGDPERAAVHAQVINDILEQHREVQFPHGGEFIEHGVCNTSHLTKRDRQATDYALEQLWDKKPN